MKNSDKLIVTDSAQVTIPPEMRAHCPSLLELANVSIMRIFGLNDAMLASAWDAGRLHAKSYPRRYQHPTLRETGRWTPIPNAMRTLSEAFYCWLARVFFECRSNPQDETGVNCTLWDATCDNYKRIFGH